MEMQKNPGWKVGKLPTSKRSLKKLPVTNQVKHTYAIEEDAVQTETQTPNTNAFYVKKKQSHQGLSRLPRILKVGRGSLKLTNGALGISAL